MWFAAFVLGAWWMWWLKQPEKPRQYVARDKSARRICV